MKNRYSIWRLMSLGAALMTAPWLQAQDVLVTLEAEKGIITLPAKVKPVDGSTIEGISGGKYVGDNDPGSSIVFNDVEVPEAGTYEFKTYYMSMQNRSIAVKVNNYSEYISTVSNTTPGWDVPPTNEMSTYIYMDKGKNTIKITPMGSGGPNMDKFEIITTDVELPKPGESPIVLEAETAQLFGNLKVKPTDGSSVAGLSGGKYIGDFDLVANSYDFTDEAEISSTQENSTLSLLTDNDEYTYYIPETSNVEIIAKCQQPVLLTGFLLSAGIDSEIDVDTWKLYASTNGSTWKEISYNKVTDLDGAHLYEVTQYPGTAAANAAQYYKLAATHENLEIAEWQLFGLPYVASGDKNFPTDLTENIDVHSNVSAYPIGESGNNFSEEFYNLFDRNMSTKYYAHEATSFYVEIDLEKPYTIESYAITSAHDYPDRDPRKWILNAYNEELGWVELDRQTDTYFPVRYSTLKYNVNSSTGFTKVMLDVEANNGAKDIQLLKFQIFGKEFNGAGINTAQDKTLSIIADQGKIIISQTEGKPVNYAVYNLSGTVIEQGTTDVSYREIVLNAGAYIVSANDGSKNKIEKLIVK